MNKLRAFILSFILLAFSSIAWSHTDQYFDSVVAPHGGQMRMAGPYHMEIIAKDKEIILYITDHANVEVSVDGGIGKATIENGETKTTVKLKPKGNNLFRAEGNFVVTQETKIMIFVKLPDQDAQAARFTPLKPIEKNKQIKNSDSHVDSHDQHSDHHEMDQHNDSHGGY
ncbi:MAG: hypothetical protein CMH70_08515 [Nitrosomonadaceae bacterium]|nr:hypothetical protein [Nitrosomonadaceae bacterium]|tara:strand:+ start:164 stop:673 length:510 start_codon:yes stop_codon:yes gene_type:complete